MHLTYTGLGAAPITLGGEMLQRDKEHNESKTSANPMTPKRKGEQGRFLQIVIRTEIL